MSDPIDVVFITGSPRSGTTIIDRVLGSMEGVTSHNEIRGLWKGALSDQPCACGSAFHQCVFWKAVLSDMGIVPADIERILELQMSVDRMRLFHRLYLSRLSERLEQARSEYANCMGSLYRSIARVSGKRVIVDSTKSPARALILHDIPGLRVQALHVVRDPRAVVYSRTFRRRSAVTRAQRVLPHHRMIAEWIAYNQTSELLARRMPYVRVLYEEVMQNPRRSFEAVARRLDGVLPDTMPFTGDDSILLAPVHSLAGNLGRFQSGHTVLRRDDEWLERLPATHRWLTTVATFPWLARYGYPWTPPAVPPSAGPDAAV